MEKTLLKFALQNAILHNGIANSKTVLAKILGEKPEFRKNAKEIYPIANKIVLEINKLSLNEQISKLHKIAPELLEKQKKEKIEELPELENVKGNVVMRFAPGPSGPLHIGHSRAAILNDEYVKRYKGKLIIRLEDTNPKKIDISAYDMILEDLEWLGVKYDEVVIQSDRFSIYYEYAKKLLDLEKAYICTCDVEEWRKLKVNKKPCPHRNLDKENQIGNWEGMLDGGFKEGEASYVVKTDLDHKNPAVRDFVGFRIIEEEHPKVKKQFRVYPLYNFSVSIDDHLLGCTHVLRGKDHLNNTFRQKYIYDYFGWEKPKFIHYGWVSIDKTILKTSTIDLGIKDGNYTGWDDVRLGTFRALEKRGIKPEAIRRYWINVGIKEVDINFSWQNLYAYNKNIIDKIANRYFFVWDPQQIKINGIEKLESHAPLHPDFPERGIRKTELKGKNGINLYITKVDLEKIANGEKVRLKDLCNVKFISDKEVEYIGNELSIIKEGVKIIHWVYNGNPMQVIMPNGEMKKGICETHLENEEKNIVQFERFGFVKLDRTEKFISYYSHK